MELTPKQLKKLQKIEKMTEDDLSFKLAIIDSFEEVEEKVEEISDSLNSFKDEVTSKLDEVNDNLKKKLEEELVYEVDESKIVESVISQIPVPKDGEDYVLTDKDKKDIAKSIEVPIVEKVIVENTIVDFDYEKVKEYIPLVPNFTDIRNAFEVFPDEEKLKTSAIYKLDETLEKLREDISNSYSRVVSNNRNLYNLLDVNLSGLTVDDSIKWNGTQWIPYTPSSGGDRYKTTSTTSHTIVPTGTLTFTVDAGLAYTALQDVSIVYDISNHMHGEVVSYSGTSLVVDIKHKTGSGTYALWTINLDGISAGVPTLQEVTDEGDTTTNAITVPAIYIGGASAIGEIFMWDEANSEYGTPITVSDGSINFNYNIFANTVSAGAITSTGSFQAGSALFFVTSGSDFDIPLTMDLIHREASPISSVASGFGASRVTKLRTKNGSNFDMYRDTTSLLNPEQTTLTVRNSKYIRDSTGEREAHRMDSTGTGVEHTLFGKVNIDGASSYFDFDDGTQQSLVGFNGSIDNWGLYIYTSSDDIFTISDQLDSKVYSFQGASNGTLDLRIGDIDGNDNQQVFRIDQANDAFIFSNGKIGLNVDIPVADLDIRGTATIGDLETGNYFSVSNVEMSFNSALLPIYIGDAQGAGNSTIFTVDDNLQLFTFANGGVNIDGGTLAVGTSGAGAGDYTLRVGVDELTGGVGLGKLSFFDNADASYSDPMELSDGVMYYPFAENNMITINATDLNVGGTLRSSNSSYARTTNDSYGVDYVFETLTRDTDFPANILTGWGVRKEIYLRTKSSTVPRVSYESTSLQNTVTATYTTRRSIFVRDFSAEREAYRIDATGTGVTNTLFGSIIAGSGRILGFQGTDVASANNLVLGQGNVFEITGTTQINLISNLSWQNGSQVTLLFTSTPTVKHNQATSGTNITIQLAGAVDFVATAGDTLTLMLSEIGGTQAWREVSRAVI